MDEHAIIDGLSGGDPILAGLESRLPDSPTDPRLLKDAASKLDRLRWWMHTQSLDGVLISRRDNFAWLTVGGTVMC